jgi:hypothetical protein
MAAALDVGNDTDFKKQLSSEPRDHIYAPINIALPPLDGLILWAMQ